MKTSDPEAVSGTELRIRNEILIQLRDASGASAVQRKEEVREEKRLILAALERYEG